MVFDAIQARTLFITGDDVAIPATVCLGIATKLLITLLEAREKREYLRQPFSSYPPETIANTFNRTFLWWLNRTFVTGFRKLMTHDDLDSTSSDLRSRVLAQKLQTSWESRCTLGSQAVPPSRWMLPLASFSCFRSEVLLVIPARLFLIGFNYAQPFLFARAIKLLADPTNVMTENYGYGLIAATGIIYVGIALATVRYQQSMFKTLTMFRGAMVSLVFDHSIALSDHMNADNAAISHMSTDIDALSRSLVEINEFWARLIEVGLGIGLLASQIGGVAVVPIVLVGVSTYCQRFVSSTIGAKRKAWSGEVQKRIGITATILGSMKSVKIMGLGSVVEHLIQSACLAELRASRGFMWLILAMNFVAVIPATWAPTITFIVYAIQATVRHTESLGIAQAFTSLALLTLVTTPASKLLTVLPQSAAAMGCFERLQKFLLLQVASDRAIARYGIERDSSLPIASSHPSEVELQTFIAKADTEQAVITVEDLTVCPTTTSPPAISHASFRIERASVTALLGPTGSGKTTLLRALLGELRVESGLISPLRGPVAYCAQTPWLVNLSVRSNICGPFARDTAIHETWYEEVLHACCLDSDLSIFPQGDSTQVGSKGFTLSGGQRHRVALARAVYSRQRTLILDDAMSAVDQNTAQLMLARLLGPKGLLRKSQSTVLIATHSMAVLPFTDMVLRLDTSGELTTSHNTPTFKIESFATIADYTKPLTDPDSSSSPEKSKARPTGSSDDDRKALSTNMGDTSIYRFYFGSIGLTWFIAFIVTTIAGTFCSHFSQVWLQFWTSNGGTHLSLYLPVFVVLALLTNIFTNLNMWIMFLNIMPRSVAHLHSTLLKTTLIAPLSFFASTDTGNILNRFSQDISLTSMTLPTSLLSSGIALFDSLAQAALISLGSAYMAITIPFVLLAIYLIQAVYLRTSRQIRFMDLEAKAPVYSHFLEVGEGVATIRAFGWQEAAKERNADLLDASQTPYYLMYCIQRWLQLVLDLLVAVMAVVVMALAVSLRSSTSAGLLGVALNNILGFNQSLGRFVREWTNLETSLAAISRVKEFSETTGSERDCDHTNPASPSWPWSGSIVLSNVSASYTADDSRLILSDISFEIAAGQKIGICGRTGSGKSSLLLTFLRLLELTSGSITIDGQNIANISLQKLRSSITTVAQDPLLLPMSIRQNLDLRSTAADESIIAALRKVCLWDLVSERGGLDAILSKDSVSQGQLQLLALARALLQTTKILLLDEATSNLDAETDQIMQKVIQDEFASCTVIAIAHRLDTISEFDKIAVLDHGRLVAFDYPDAILRRRDCDMLLEA
ncbi:putative multidrug resistance protein [Aureobasidium pullulans EXF-150]|uniref:Putative multidrug resistance protein n=1 Tax=Aureobasidium pullulans EXF-150 TaxID=1043002 RepID=A0A074X575_AURPU|nr:putative multidrug resistance protein [Aureobasidium pullulans EXF-150]KEQ80625.1 putative multidrug resistance protein [Aureobasidium pullulans EXF-150]